MRYRFPLSLAFLLAGFSLWAQTAAPLVLTVDDFAGWNEIENPQLSHDGRWVCYQLQPAPGDYALYNKCNTGEFGQSSCLFRGDAGTIQFNMRQHGATWVVSMAVFSPA